MTARSAGEIAGGDFPPHVLREYSLLADGERGALVGPRGDIAWLCAPRWHDDAVFSTLVGGAGTYAVTPRQRFVWGGSYIPGSLVWRDRWTTKTGCLECHEALARPADQHRLVLLRRIIPVHEDAEVRVVLDLRAGFGSHRARRVHRDDAGRWTGRTGDLYFRWSGAARAHLDDSGVLTMDLTVPGEHHDLVLEVSDRSLPDPVDAGALWQETLHDWEMRVPALAATIAPRDARHAVAVMHGLTSADGGMVAAATLGLPERAEQGRSYDYRYAWVRDQCYAGVAAATAGVDALLDSAVRFVTARLLEDGPRLRPAYLVDGGRVPDQRRLGLSGYPGGRDVVGNHANRQWQLDSVGEVLQLLAAAAERDRLDDDGRRAVQLAVEVVADRWEEPDAGIWELADEWWTHSRLACVAGLRRVAGASDGPLVGRAAGLADRLLAETSRRCLRRDGAWQRAANLPEVDAALVLPPVRGALPADDPRTRTTLAAVERELAEEHYAYRYAHGAQPLGDAEGAFAVCGFFMALAKHHQGAHVAAYRWFERNRAACGPPGLFSEEFDVQQRQLRGNLPQAFVHALLLECTATLHESPALDAAERPATVR